MPVIRLSGRSSLGDTVGSRLTEILIKELMGEAVFQGPVVIEEPNGLDGINVFVVWQAWRPLASGERSAIIRSAYDRYTKALVETCVFALDPHQPSTFPVLPRVIGAAGTTPEEVVEHGFLPFSVEPRHDMDAIDQDQAEVLMRRAGAIETPPGFQLRLPSYSMAAEVLARLKQEMPEARWTIPQLESYED